MKPLPLLFAIYLGLLSLTGCVAPVTSQTATNTDTQATSTESTVANSTAVETHIVTDIRGNEVEIPVDPQRIVALDYNTVEELVALGITPVGTLYGNNPYIADRLVGVPVVGTEGVPNLEKVLQLDPDLILAVDWWVDDATYAQLQEIAPTVMTERLGFRDWKKYLRNTAELVGRSEKAEELLAEYDAHVAQVRAAIGEAWLAANEVTVFSAWNEYLRVWVDSFCNTVLNDVGIRIPQVQYDALPESEDDERLEGLSLEQIPMLDADVIFYLDTTGDVDTGYILENPLWLQLPAVQAGKAYGVDVPWNEGSILAAHMLLDTLEEYLAQEGAAK